MNANRLGGSSGVQPHYFVTDSLDAAAAEPEALDLAGLKALAGPL